MHDYLPENRKHKWWGGESIASQKISYKDPEVQAQVSTDRVNKYFGSSKRGKEARLKEKEWGEKRGLRVGWERKGGHTDVSCHLQIPRRYETFPWPPEEDWNLAQPEPKFKFFAKRRWSVSNPQLRVRTFDQIPVSRTGGQEKNRLG